MFKHFQTKLTVFIFVAISAALFLSNAVVYKYSVNQQFQSIRKQLMIVAQTTALMIDSKKLMNIPLSKQGVQSLAFHEIQERLQEVQASNPAIKSIYTMTKTAKPGIWQFIVDGEPDTDEEGKEYLTAYPGDTYDASRFTEMLKAFDGPSADLEVEIDEWGATLSGYAPIYNLRKEAVAMVGVDMAADDIYALKKDIQKRMILIFVIGLLMAIVLGFFISKYVVGPIHRLTEATQELAHGNWGHRVKIKTKDEFEQLASAFNGMAQKLHQSHKKLLSYFYDAVDSLLNILEARDQYTRGHCEDVAVNAAKIAQKMGYSKDTVELFKTITILHDIGKIGIPDYILKKPGKLTDEEWEIMRSHPEIGERILKPILFDNDVMLSVVRHHHERYDGKGYPDQVSQEDLNIFAAIVTVVDSYDAMMSDRVYRKSLGKEKAVEELKKHRGAQFHPKVVDVFLQILKEEESA